MENHHAIKFGKPSISIRPFYTMAMLVITRGYTISVILFLPSVDFLLELRRVSVLHGSPEGRIQGLLVAAVKVLAIDGRSPFE